MTRDPIRAALDQLAAQLEATEGQSAELGGAVDLVNRARAGRGQPPVSLPWLAEHALRAAGLSRAERKAVLALLRTEPA